MKIYNPTGFSSSLTGSFSGSVKGTLTATGNIIPVSDQAFDLGSSDKRFRDIYLSSASIYLGNKVISEDNVVTTASLASTLPSGVISSSNQLAGETIDGDLTITGTITAQEFHTEYTSASIVYQSGSTKFGDSNDDTHEFTGSIKAADAFTFNAGGTINGNVEYGAGNGWRSYNGTNTNNRLTLNQNSNVHPVIYNYDDTGATGFHSISIGGGNNLTSGLLIKSGDNPDTIAFGNVGIGTDSPSNTYSGLTIYGSNPSLALETSNSSGWVWTQYVNSSGTNNFSMGVNQTQPHWAVKAGAGLDSPHLIVNTSGSVGIGTTSPDALLHIDYEQTGVAGNSWIGLHVDRSYATTTGFYTGLALTAYQNKGALIGADGSQNLMFFNYDGVNDATTAERMRIDSSGVIHSKAGSSSNDNVRFYNQDGNYSYIRQTAASNSNNVWFDGVLGSIMWYAWDNPGSLRTADTYTRHMFGSGRGTSAQILTIDRAKLSGTNSSATTTYVIDPQGYSYFNGGSVGIGTTNPINQLHIANSGTPVINLERLDDLLGAGDVIGTLRFTSESPNTIISQIFAQSDQNYTTKGRLVFQTNNGTSSTEVMRIDSVGYVGIGDLGGSASVPLHIYKDSADVNSNNDVMLTLQNTRYGSTDASDTYENKLVFGWANHYAAGISGYKYTVNTTGLKFYTEYGFNVPAERMRISPNGNVGIGTTSPDALLHLRADAPYIYLDDASTTGTRNRLQIISGDVGTVQTGIIGFNNTSGTSNLDVLAVNETGDVGIQTTAPIARLEINGGALGTAKSTVFHISAGSVSSGGGPSIFLKASGNNTFDRFGTKISAVRNVASNGSSDFVIEQEPTGLGGVDTTFHITADGQATKPKQPYFNVQIGTSAVTISSDTKLAFPVENWDIGSNYDTTNSRFTCPVSGRYLFTLNSSLQQAVSGDYNAIYIKVNGAGTGFRFRTGPTSTGIWTGIIGSCILNLAASDYIEIWAYTHSGSMTLQPNETILTGYLLG